MVKVVTLDLGPTFMGQATRIDDETVCALPSAALHDEQFRATVMQLMEAQGAPCSNCLGCQVTEAIG
jgi:hypothetical protein